MTNGSNCNNNRNQPGLRGAVTGVTHDHTREASTVPWQTRPRPDEGYPPRHGSAVQMDFAADHAALTALAVSSAAE